MTRVEAQLDIAGEIRHTLDELLTNRSIQPYHYQEMLYAARRKTQELIDSLREDQ